MGPQEVLLDVFGKLRPYAEKDIPEPTFLPTDSPTQPIVEKIGPLSSQYNSQSGVAKASSFFNVVADQAGKKMTVNLLGVYFAHEDGPVNGRAAYGASGYVSQANSPEWYVATVLSKEHWMQRMPKVARDMGILDESAFWYVALSLFPEDFEEMQLREGLFVRRLGQWDAPLPPPSQLASMAMQKGATMKDATHPLRWNEFLASIDYEQEKMKRSATNLLNGRKTVLEQMGSKNVDRHVDVFLRFGK